MSDKTKVLSRKKQQNGSTTVVKYLICEFKKQIKSSLYSKYFTFQHTVQKSKSAVRAARKKNKPACKENPRGLLFCILYIKGLLLFL